MTTARVESPVGPLFVTEEDGAIMRLSWRGREEGQSPLLADAAAQFDDYFKGKRQAFDLPFRVSGTAFQRAVCDAMLAIPFGETRTYGDLARELGVTAQAVGQGCGGNPIPVLIPCHRVLAASGLGGYSGEGGIETKVALLRLEGAGGLLL
ncbi:methylated-DNA--[protein]-cysteine S-methyltransferase [Maritimibacter sp. DP1N21-5]|uniref:methylated-DNA--[protein]-cysteine S-methyltransferase n=1 Tax=Maritimibacter sp. DP1N21-5 TaxID=2836867 RepID=UPI00351D3A4A